MASKQSDTKKPSQPIAKVKRDVVDEVAGKRVHEVKLDEHESVIFDKAVAALADDLDTYRRGGVLVHVVRNSPERVTYKRKAGAVRPGMLAIKVMARPTLGLRLATAARWIDMKGKGYVKAPVPKEVVDQVYEAGHWPGVRDLLSVSDSPTMRPDGTVLQESGYDDRSGIYVQLAQKFPKVAEEPTQLDAAKALARIADLFCDFPFANEVAKSAAVSIALTIVARPAIDGPTPLFIAHASTPGTGKSLLQDLAVAIATGSIPEHNSRLPKEEEEARKIVTSILSSGARVAMFDNASGKVGSPIFDALLTSRTWTGRILGRGAMATMPVQTVFLTNGNNLQIKGDLARRAIVVELETTIANPEMRDGFKHGHEVAQLARENHAELLWCALTVLRAWTSSGKWQPHASWGAFDSWSSLVGGAIEYAGMPSPLSARATSASIGGDENLGQLTALLDELARLDVGEFRVRSLLSQLYGAQGPYEGIVGDALREVCEEIAPPMRAGAEPDAQRLGWWMRSQKGRVSTSRRRLVAAGNTGGVARWRVESMTGAPELEPPPATPYDGPDDEQAEIPF